MSPLGQPVIYTGDKDKWGQIGIMEVKVLQEEIKSIIAKLRWSQNKLAYEIYIAKNEIDDDDEIQRFREKLKKDLSRPTTKLDLLEDYLKIISEHPDFKRLNILVPNYRASNILSDTVESGMKNISKMLNKLAE